MSKNQEFAPKDEGPSIHELTLEGDDQYLEANQELHARLDEELDRRLDVLIFSDLRLGNSDASLVKDERLSPKDREERRVRELELMCKADALFSHAPQMNADLLASGGEIVFGPIDDEIRLLAKRLILLMDRQRQRLGLPVLSAATLIQMVYEIAYTDFLHRDHRRNSGESYARTHLIGAMENLIVFTGLTGASTAIAALRHDDFEDLPIHAGGPKNDLLFCVHAYRKRLEALLPEGPLEDRIREMTQRTGGIVRAVTNIKHETGTSKDITEGRSFRFFLSQMVDGPRVAFVRLAERLHNVQTIASANPGKGDAKLLETMRIHQPMAGLLGLRVMERALTELCFGEMNPSALERFGAIRSERIYAQLGETEERRNTPLLKDLMRVVESDPRVLLLALVPRSFCDYADPSALNDPEYVPSIDDWDPMFEVYVEVQDDRDVKPVTLELLTELDYTGDPDIRSAQGQGTRIDFMSPKYKGHRVQLRINARRTEARSIRGVLPRGDEVSPEHISRGIKEILRRTQGRVEDVFLEARRTLLKPTIRVITPAAEERVLLSGSTGLDLAAAIHSDLPALLSHVVRRRKPQDPGERIDVFTPLNDGDIVELVRSPEVRVDLGRFIFANAAADRALAGSYKRLSEHERNEAIRSYFSRLATLLGLSASDHDPLLKKVEREYFEARQSGNRREKSPSSPAFLKSLLKGAIDPLEFFAKHLGSDVLEVAITMPDAPGMAAHAATFFKDAGINLKILNQEEAGDGKARFVLQIDAKGAGSTPYDLLKVLLRLDYAYPVLVRSGQFATYL